jgi:hypothetical protein
MLPLTKIAQADTVYAVTNLGAFGTLNTTTGVFSLLGNLGFSLPSGLAELNGAYYTAQAGTNTLYSVNPTNGAVTPIGTGSLTYEGIGSTTTGLYAFGAGFNLFSINPGTGATSLIGSTGFTSGPSGLSTGSSTLYMADGSNLYSLNTSNGSSTLAGPFVNESFFGSLVVSNGVLYGSDDSLGTVDVISPTTGSATVGPALTGVTGAVWGMAPEAPEPDTGITLFIGAAGLVFAFRVGSGRRKRSEG